MTSAIGGSCSATSAMRTTGSTGFAGKMFDALDTKKQGYLSEADIQSALSSTPSTSSSAKDVLAALDGDGDGKVTKAEFTDAIDKMAQQLGEQMMRSRIAHGRGPAGPPAGKPPSVDGAGFTKDELSAMASKASSNSAKSQSLQSLVANFDAADTDGDGKVSFAEARAFREKEQTSETGSAAGGSDPAQRFLQVIAQYLSSESGNGNEGGVGQSLAVSA